MKLGRKNIYHRLPFLNNDYKARIYTGKYTYKIYYENKHLFHTNYLPQKEVTPHIPRPCFPFLHKTMTQLKNSLFTI